MVDGSACGDQYRSTDSQDRVTLLMEEDGKTDTTAGRSRSGGGKYQSPWKGRGEVVRVPKLLGNDRSRIWSLLVYFLSSPVQPAVLGEKRQFKCIFHVFQKPPADPRRPQLSLPPLQGIVPLKSVGIVERSSPSPTQNLPATNVLIYWRERRLLPW